MDHYLETFSEVIIVQGYSIYLELQDYQVSILHTQFLMELFGIMITYTINYITDYDTNPDQKLLLRNFIII